MKTRAIIGLIGGSLMMAGLAAEAGDWTGKLQAGAGFWSGDTTYSIGGAAWTPETGSVQLPDKISELTFPFDAAMGTLGGSLFYKSRFELYGEIMANLTDPSSKVTDSDWGLLSDNPDTLDIYSESDAELSAFSLDGGARYWFVTSPATNQTFWALAVGPGLLLQNCDWTLSNVDEWSPSNPQLGHQYEPGRAATYSTTTLMPYMEVSAMMKIRKLSGGFGFGVGPVLVHDEDDHILRQKRSSADLFGGGMKTSLEAKYDFTRHIFARARITALLIAAAGTQTQTGYGGDLAGFQTEIDETYTSRSFTGDLSLGYAF